MNDSLSRTAIAGVPARCCLTGRIGRLAAALIVAAGAWDLPGYAETDWRGFHGLAQQGIAARTNATERWEGRVVQEWSTPLPGEGFSSPVTDGEAVYLTSAYADPGIVAKERRLDVAVRWVSLIMLLGGAGWILATFREGRYLGSAWLWRGLLAAYVGGLMVVAASCWTGAQTLRLEANPDRAWKLSLLIGSLGVYIGVVGCGSRLGAWLLGVMGLSGLAIAGYCIKPASADIFNLSSRAGLANTLVMVLPAATAWVAVVVFGVRRWRSEGSIRRDKVQEPVGLGIGIADALGFGVLPGAAILAGFWYLGRGVAQQPSNDLLEAVRPDVANLWLLGGVLAVGCAAGLWGRSREAGRAIKFVGRLVTLTAVVAGLGFFVLHGYLPSQRTLVGGVLKVQLKDGKLLWSKEIATIEASQSLRGNTYATPTPVVTDQGVCVCFGPWGLVGIGTVGDIVWSLPELRFSTPFGIGHSPTLWAGTLVLVNDAVQRGKAEEDARSEILAISAEDGKVVWREPRSNAGRTDASYATPIVREFGAKPIVLVQGWESINAYDLASGDVLWGREMRYRGRHLVASMVSHESTLYAVDGSRVFALNVEHASAVEDPVIWSTPLMGEKASTPVITEGLVFVLTEEGVVACLDAATGRMEWKQRFPGRFFASPLVVDRNVVFANEAGDVRVIEAARAFRLKSEFKVGLGVRATPFCLDGRLFFRTRDSLECLTLARGGEDGQVTQ